MAERKLNCLLVGLGSHHGDDQIGWKLAEELSKLTDIPVRQAAVPADLLHWLADLEELYVCDACLGSGQAGRLHRWEYLKESQPLDDVLAGVELLRSMNTHQISLAATLSLAQQLQMLPRHIVVWGIEGMSFAAGQPISAELYARLPDLCTQLASELCHA